MKTQITIILSAICYSVSAQYNRHKLPTDTNKLMSNDKFAEISAPYISNIIGAQGTSGPSNSNIGIDLLDAKFDIKGTVGFLNNLFFVNAALSGDKEGNTVTLIENKKSGGKFDGELKINWSPWRRFYFNETEKDLLQRRLDLIDYEYYNKYLEVECAKKIDPCSTDTKFNYSDLEKNAIEGKLQMISDSAEIKIDKAYQTAKWNSLHQIWFTVKGKLGGSTVYSVDQLLSPTINKNQLTTKYLGVELNYFYHNTNGFTLFLNTGLGAVTTNNLSELEKTTISETSSLIDTTIKEPSTRKVEYPNKYDAFIGHVISKDDFMSYIHCYNVFGKNQPLGFHIGLERFYQTKRRDFIAGLIINGVKKGEVKSKVAVELFVRINGFNKSTELDFDNQRKSLIGLTFNVPLVSLPTKE